MARPRLSKQKLALLEELIQYLNLAEMRCFCSAHELPLYIHVELSNGRLRRTGDRDRKDVVLRRILDFAVKGERTGPTIYPKAVVADEGLPKRLTRRSRIHYGQYEKKNEDFLAQLQKLTGGAFRFGMIARLVLRDAWTAGEAPTLEQFAQAWLRADREHTQPRPEGAYLVDLARGTAGKDWRAARVEKARTALEMLGELVSRH